MRNVTEEEKQLMVELFNQGKTKTEIAKITGFCLDTVRFHLKSILKDDAYKRDMYSILTEEDKRYIAKLYIEGDWDEIFNKYDYTKHQVYSLMSNMGIKKEHYFWNKQDEQILIDNYGLPYKDIKNMLLGEHSVTAIKSKAISMGLTSPQEWSQEEINILKNNYSTKPIQEVMDMLPKRTYNAIIGMAVKLKIKSFYQLGERYTDEEKQFIVDNFGILTDEEIAEKINKTAHGIRDQRARLGLCYFNKDYSNYENFAKLFRGHIQEWKTASMKKCNYQCILTGNKTYKIHHLYGFNLIVKEVFEKLDELKILKSDSLEDYTKEELDYCIKIFKEIHNKSPLGVCVREDIHKLFHKIYGAGGNTEAQWDIFVENYKNHQYDSLLN